MPQERDGWYTALAFERIKKVLRHKFFALLSGYVATEDECLALLEEKASAGMHLRDFSKRRPGKHNMAKGAIPPEDAAVRLDFFRAGFWLTQFCRPYGCVRHWIRMLAI